MQRREFVRCALAAGACAAAASVTRGARASEIAGARPAEHFERLDENRVRCLICPRRCEVADRERGTCGVRENRGGDYLTLAWGRCCTEHVDPIEKKPFFHYRPGTGVYSFAAPGCNIECLFCQNWEISQLRPEQIETWERTPERIASYCADNRIPTIAATYSEPVVFWEWVRDVAVAASEKGVDTVVVTNGYIERKPLEEWCKVVSAVKVDFKAFTQRFYAEQCSGELAPVLDALGTIKDSGVWLELVMLVIPTLNDSEREVRAMARWILQRLGPDVPVHFTRFHPMYKLRNIEPTPVGTLERCRDAATAEGLRYVYLGNVRRHPGENTYCPTSGQVLIRRLGYTIAENRLVDGRCPCCDREVPGIWRRVSTPTAGAARSATSGTPAS